jgi:two-component system OmpR family response regulator
MVKALIIDDEVDACLLLSNLLRSKNVQTACVHTLSEASVILSADEPNIVFLDNHLPDGMGMDFIQHIKKHFATAKVVMITAYDNASDRNKAMELGIDSFIAKPFTRESIYDTLEMLTVS